MSNEIFSIRFQFFGRPDFLSHDILNHVTKMDTGKTTVFPENVLSVLETQDLLIENIIKFLSMKDLIRVSR